MLGNLTGWHLLIILAVVLLIFGAAKLPALARSMGQSARILKSEMKSVSGSDSAPDPGIPGVPGSVTPAVVAEPSASPVPRPNAAPTR